LHTLARAVHHRLAEALSASRVAWPEPVADLDGGGAVSPSGGLGVNLQCGLWVGVTESDLGDLDVDALSDERGTQCASSLGR